MSASFFLPLLLQSALLPFCVALAVLFAGHRTRWRDVSTGTAILLALLASFAFVHPGWSPHPRQALDWLPWIGVLALGAAVLAQRAVRTPTVILLRAGLGVVTVLLVLSPVLGSLGLSRALGIAGVAASLLTVFWGVLGAARNRLVPAVVLAIVAGGSGLALMIDASQSLGQLHGALAMACAACLMAALLGRSVEFGPVATGVALLLLTAMLVNAYLYAEFSLAYVALLLAGLAGALAPVGLRATGRPEAGAGAFIMAGIGAAVPVLVALVLVVKAAQDSGGY